MELRCKTCRNLIAAGLVVCPFCGNPPTEEPTLEIKPDQIKQVAKQVYKEMWKKVIYWFGIMSLLCGLGFYQAYRAGVDSLQGLLVKRISKEFEEPTIKKTINDVATSQANHLINDEIAPERRRITEQIADFGNYLNDTEYKFNHYCPVKF